MKEDRMKLLILFNLPLATVLALAALTIIYVTGCSTMEKPSGLYEIKPYNKSGEWIKDTGVRVKPGGVPYALKLPDGRIRLYYCSTSGGIVSATSRSKKGLIFDKDYGVRIRPGEAGGPEGIVCDPTVIILSRENYRMYYKGAVGPGGPKEARHKIFTAFSKDGLNWKKEGLVIGGGKVEEFASVPEAILLSDGRIRLYYVTGERPHGIAIAISKNGLDFERETGIILPGMVDPGVIKLPDGTFLMVAVFLNPQKAGVPDGIYTLRSMDGRSFELNPDPVIYPSGLNHKPIDPTIIALTGGNYRIYYWEAVEHPENRILSATGKVLFEK